MSLINDMLKDLDGPRRQRSPSRRAVSAPLQQNPVRRWLLPSLAALSVVYWILFEWNLFGWAPEAPEAAQPAVAPLVLNPLVSSELERSRRILESRQAPSTATAVGPGPTTADVVDTDRLEISASIPSPEPAGAGVGSTAAPDVELRLARQRLLSSAYQALAEDRLTVPDNNSAYYFFSTVLLMDPEDQAAQRGLDAVRDRYLALLHDAVARNDVERANTLTKGARRAGVAGDVIEQALAKLSEMPAHGSRAAQTAPTEIKNPARHDRNLARSLVRNGLAGNEVRALQWLGSGLEVQETALALIDIYSASGSTEKLTALHQRLQGRELPLAVLADAHLHWLRGATPTAVTQLESVEYDGNAELARLRLLGGLLQESGDYARAESVYARLVRNPQAGSRDWLGLAVALDRQGKINAARQAYQHLTERERLSAEVAAFVNRRLNELALSARR